MPRSSRQSRSHGRHKKRSFGDYYLSDSEDEGSPRYGPKKQKESKGKAKVDNAVDENSASVGSKRKPSPRDLSSSKKKRAAGVSVSDKEDVLSLLDKDYESDSSSEKISHKSKHCISNGTLGDVSARAGKSKDSHDLNKEKVYSKVKSKECELKSGNVQTGIGGTNSCKQVSQTGDEDTLVQKKASKSTEWRLQDEHRNPELERELENRILRRKEEAGDRDRWRDDDRDREGKLYGSRDSHYRDDKYKGRQKEERCKGNERHKDDRKVERLMDEKTRSDKHKDERSRSDREREDRSREDRHRESRHKEERHRDEKYRHARSKDERCKSDKSRDDKLDDNQRDGKQKEDKNREGKHRDDKCKDDKYKDEKHRNGQLSCEGNKKLYQDNKHCKGESGQQAHDQDDKHYDSDQEYNSYSYEKVQLPRKRDGLMPPLSNDINYLYKEQISAAGRGCEDDAMQEQSASSLPGISNAHASSQDGQQRKAADIDSLVGRGRKRLKITESDMDRKENMIEEKTKTYKQESFSRRRTRSDRHHVSNREHSPIGSTDSSLRSYDSCRSPSPYTRDRGYRSYGKTQKRTHSDSDRAFSKSHSKRGDIRKSEDQSSGKLRPSEVTHTKDNGFYRERSDSKDRACNYYLNNSRRDRHSWASSINGSQEDASADYHLKRSSMSNHASATVEGSKSYPSTDKMKSNISGWSQYGQNSKNVGPSVQQMLSPFHARPSGYPPPPPFRQGVDNPAVLGPSGNSFDENQVRPDWNVRNWNPQAQIPSSTNMFMPFHHQAGGHSSGPFPNMGQQHAGLHFFRGIRPADSGHGIPYTVWDNGDGIAGHNGVFGWQRQHDDVCAPPYQGSFHTWDGYAEESHIYARRDWHAFGQGIGIRGWERLNSMSRVHKMDGGMKSNQNDSNFAFGDNITTSAEVQDCKVKHVDKSPAHSFEVKKSSQISQNGISESSALNSSVEAKNYCRHANEVVKHYLSKIDISAKLADADLYNQCMNIVGGKVDKNLDNNNIVKNEITDDSQFEGDADAMSLLSSHDMRHAFFPSVSRNHIQQTQELYKKFRTDVNDNAIRVAWKAESSFLASSCFDFDKEAPFHAESNGTSFHTALCPGNENISSPKNPTPSISDDEILCASQIPNNTKRSAEIFLSERQHIYHSHQTELVQDCCISSSPVELSNDLPSGKCSSNGKLRASPMVSNSIVDMQPDQFDGIASPEHDPVLVVDRNNFLDESDNDSGGATNHVSNDSAFNMTNMCKFCNMQECLGLNEFCLQCQDVNQLKSDLSGNILVQQSEVLEPTRIAVKEALKSELVDSKELVSAACILHILREVSFLARIPAILLEHLVLLLQS